jgi:hypothetical protein
VDKPGSYGLSPFSRPESLLYRDSFAVGGCAESTATAAASKSRIAEAADKGLGTRERTFEKVLVLVSGPNRMKCC